MFKKVLLKRSYADFAKIGIKQTNVDTDNEINAESGESVITPAMCHFPYIRRSDSEQKDEGLPEAKKCKKMVHSKERKRFIFSSQCKYNN